MVSVHQERGVRDLSGLARHVAAWAWAWVVVQFVLCVFSFLELLALQDFPSAQPLTWEDSVLEPQLEMAAGIVAIVVVIVTVGSAIVSLKWIYRANANAHQFAEGLAVSPGWNVGWFFVPIATFFKPYQGVQETWRASHDPKHWREREVPSFLHLWWGFWLAMSVLSTAGFRIEIRASTVGGRQWADALDAASSLFAIPATIYFVRLVRELTAVQASRRSERLASDGE